MIIISKQKTSQKYIYKLHSSRLRKAKWKLSLPLNEARENGDDIITLSSSEALRTIDSERRSKSFQPIEEAKNLSHYSTMICTNVDSKQTTSQWSSTQRKIMTTAASMDSL